MKSKNLLYTFTTAIILFNCSNSSTEDLSEPTQDPDPTAIITYDTDIMTIINDNCIQCHGTPPTGGAPTSFTTYTQVKSSINSILTRINNSGSAVMPPTGQMPLATRELIQQWKDDGLLEN
ncbi:hypothetical protein [Thalassobellus suaedae]|uniref:Cytochrome c domain-containing protein n=1 Tax=Thalassobellus suaedae TaxID=3074124 RepID=A0ABY9Y4M5_9FLAO|nr:hypothetical protein RHP51_11795 [Flavobacteriaceae bacterium HL-DH14]WNH13189.1 hypothetical protein RHP49_02795 [Flavobacteriaceae bacterium HL-DH10]